MTLKDVVNGVIIKRGSMAEIEDSKINTTIGLDPYKLFDEYKNALRKTDSLSTYTFTVKDLKKYTQDIEVIKYILKNPDSIRFYFSDEQIENIMNGKRQNVIDNYVELNNYYRTLMGQPNIDWTNGTRPFIPKSQEIYIENYIIGVDNTKPLHKMSKNEYSILRNSGMLDLLYSKYGFEWIKYCGLGIDILTLRDAKDFDIVYADYDIEDMSDYVYFFRNIRSAYMKTHFNDFFNTSYEYYEPIVCLHLLLTTLATVNADNIFNKNIEEKDLKFLFKSYGLPNFEFSRNYLLKLADKLNTLIMNKGTNGGLNKISDIFDGITIYKYFLIKKLKDNGLSEIKDNATAEDKYELFFVKTPLLEDDPYNYMDKEENLIPFNAIVSQDPLWGFENDNFESLLKEWETFTYSESKYITLENKVNIVTFSLESSYFYRYMLEHRKEFGRLRFYLDVVEKECDIVEIITYLQCLVFRKFNVSPDIPDTMNNVIHMYSIKNNLDYIKVKRQFKEHFKWHKDDKLNNIDIDKFIDIIDGTIHSFQDTLDIFENNYSIIEYLYKLRKSCTHRDDYEAVTNVIKAITYGEKIPEIYNGESNLENFLSTYTAEGNVFQARLIELENSDDRDVAFNNEINEVLSLLRNYTSVNKHKKIINLLDNAQNVYSDVDIVEYLERIINFFKSYTQDLINRGFTYVVSDINEELQVTERLTRIITLEEWEVVLLSTLSAKYNKEIVTLLTKGLFIVSEVFSLNESVVKIDEFGDIKTIGSSINSYF